jgi:peptide/nickel transport system permease protein
MGRYVARRLLQTIPVMWAVTVFAFGILQIAPGDAALALGGAEATREDIEGIRAKYGLDQPVYVQYTRWLGRVLQGDLGLSIVTRRPVLTEIRFRVKATAELAFFAMVVATVVGVIIGMVSAVRQYSLLDHVTMVLALLGVSTPVFFSGLILILVFSVKLRWFPTGGADSAKALVLPSIALSATSLAVIARMTRSSLLEVIREDYILTAQAKGLSERVVLLRHALKNALIPVVTVIGVRFGYLLGGAVVTETVFSRTGLGRLLIDGIKFRDYPVVQGTVLVLSGAFVLLNLLVDLLYAFLDPRIRYE